MSVTSARDDPNPDAKRGIGEDNQKEIVTVVLQLFLTISWNRKAQNIS